MSEQGKTCAEDPFCGMKKPKDPTNATDFEKKHTPVIRTPDTVKKGEVFSAIVEVGKIVTHPNEPGHFIQWVELYSGDTFLGRAELTPVLTDPVVTFAVRLDHIHPLKAVARCNLHGVWVGTKELKE